MVNYTKYLVIEGEENKWDDSFCALYFVENGK